jgi:hypothetical protein
LCGFAKTAAYWHLRPVRHHQHIAPARAVVLGNRLPCDPMGAVDLQSLAFQLRNRIRINVLPRAVTTLR